MLHIAIYIDESSLIESITGWLFMKNMKGGAKMRPRSNLLILVLCFTFILFACKEETGVSPDQNIISYGTIVFNGVIGEDVVHTDPGDFLGKVTFAGLNPEGVIMDKITTVLGIEITKGEVADGAADDLTWSPIQEYIDPMLFSETDFNFYLLPDTYRALRITESNSFQWKVSFYDTTRTDTTTYTASQGQLTYNLESADGDITDETTILSITSGTVTIWIDSAEIASSDYTIDYDNATITFANSPEDDAEIMALYEYSIYRIKLLDDLVNDDLDSDAVLVRVFDISGIYMYDSGNRFQKVSSTEKLSSNITVQARSVIPLVWQMNHATLIWADNDENEEWSDGDEITSFTYKAGTTGECQLIVQ